MKTYKGIPGNRIIVEETDGTTKMLSPKYSDRFGWGYEGQGAADTARAILTDLYGEDSEQIYLLTERFKVDVVAKLRGEFAITEQQIRLWEGGRKFLPLEMAGIDGIIDAHPGAPRDIALWLLAHSLFETLSNSNVGDPPEDGLFEAARLAARLVIEMFEKLAHFVN